MLLQDVEPLKGEAPGKVSGKGRTLGHMFVSARKARESISKLVKKPPCFYVWLVGMQGDGKPCEVKHGSLILPCLPSALPAEIKNCSEAAECCRLVSSMLTLMMNQQSRLPHAPASCFALVVHLMARLLPMPLPVDDAQPEACFWATDLTVETKKDLLRSLHMICRGFSAAATALSAARATREADGARTCVAAALVAVMDALLRRPLSSQLAENLAVQERHGDLFSLHYSGQSGQSGSQSGSSGFRGPCQPFVLGSGTFRETSEALLLPQPELAMLRAQALDYFQSLESEGSHAIFNFDQAMTPSSADRAGPRVGKEQGGLTACDGESDNIICGHCQRVCSFSVFFRVPIFCESRIAGGAAEFEHRSGCACEAPARFGKVSPKRRTSSTTASLLTT